MTDRSDQPTAELDWINAYLDGVLSPTEVERFDQRLAQEQALRDRLSRERRFRALLSNLPVVAMRPGFADEALAAARRDAKPGRRPSWLAPALSAGLTAVVIIGGQKLRESAPSPTSAPSAVPSLAAVSAEATRSVVVTLGRAEVVRLRINSNQAVRQVRFVVQMPESLALANAPDVRRLEWDGELEQGVNVLSLPVTGLLLQDGALNAKVILPDGERHLSLMVHVVPEERVL